MGYITKHDEQILQTFAEAKNSTGSKLVFKGNQLTLETLSLS